MRDEMKWAFLLLIGVLIATILLKSILLFFSKKTLLKAFDMPGTSFEFGEYNSGQREKGIMELTF